ncbi:MAG: protein kinase [Candidatus Sumerlaeia bacterium]|nr:protein kinase [Candidatus Sumerlaeia bacterium]
MKIQCPKCKLIIDIRDEKELADLKCPGCQIRLVLKQELLEVLKQKSKAVSEKNILDELNLKSDGLNGAIPPELLQLYKKLLKELKGNIDGYQLIKLIAVGGMGLLFKGVQTSLNRSVAIKVLAIQYVNEPHLYQQFIQEASLLAQLRHPNVVSIIDRKEIQGLPLLVMEYVEGESLKDILLKRELTLNEMLNIIVQVRNGLSYIHSQGVIHSDIKPSNILIDTMGNVKIADFGIAKLMLHKEPGSKKSTEWILGTPRYLAPEVLTSAEKMGTRSDIYSLGVTFYEMLTRVPFNPSSFKKPSELNNLLPVAVDGIIAKAIASKPEERYQHVADFCSDLINVLTGRKQNEVKTISLHPAVFLRAGILLFVILVVAVIIFGSLRFFNVRKKSETKDQIISKVNNSKSELILPSVQPVNPENKDIPSDTPKSPPISKADHLLITEVNVYDPEFIEIYNPTFKPVSLKDYYITDAIYNNGDYYLLPQGSKVKGGEHHDFIARFPPTAVIQPAESQTISLNNYQSFFRRFNTSPTYVLVKDDSTPPTIQEMVPCFPGSINPEPHYTTLSNDGESVILFYWDGKSDLVKDVD